MSSNAIDYFGYVGPSSPMQTSISMEETWWSAITDICVMFPSENDILKQGEWQLAEQYSIEKDEFLPVDRSTLYPVVIFKRRKHSRRLDHITDIKFFRQREKLEDGWALIPWSVSEKFPGNLNGKTANSAIYFAVKRAPLDLSSLIYGAPFIDDIVFLKPSNPQNGRNWIPTAPDDYTLFGISIALINNSVHYMDTSSAYAFASHICPPCGLCNIPLCAKTLDRYPKQDIDRIYKLPVEEIPLFAFPHGIKLICPSKDNITSSTDDFLRGLCPLPKFFSFIFTNSMGEYFYVACLRFYEQIATSDLESICRQFTQDKEALRIILEYLATVEIFCPKIICVISTYPFYRSMRTFLDQIYSLSLAKTSCTLESFVASLVGIVPVPIPGGRPFHVVLDASTIPAAYQSMPPIVFEIPKPAFFPLLDYDFYAPFRCFSTNSIMAIFCLLLLESRVVFLGASSQLLTEVMESFRALLFPLSWSSCYISRLPESLTSVLQAPGGFLIGIHLEVDKAIAIGENYWLNKRSAWKEDLPPGSYVVDITSSAIYECVEKKQAKTKEVVLLSDVKFSEILNLIPKISRENLKMKLQHLRESHSFQTGLSTVSTKGVNIHEQNRSLDKGSFDAFESSLASDAHTSVFASLEVRDAFLVCMVEILGSYQDFIVHPSSNLSEEVYKTLNEEFEHDQYMTATESTARPLLKRLCKTQMFASLIQQRQEGKNHSLVFFEKACVVWKKLKRNNTAFLLYIAVENWNPNEDSRLAMEVTLNKVETISASRRGSMEVATPKRGEIFDGNDLHLHIGEFPLIIPGPDPLQQQEQHGQDTGLTNNSGSEGASSEKWPILDASKLLREREISAVKLAPLHRLHGRSDSEVSKSIQHLKSFDVIEPANLMKTGPDQQFVSLGCLVINMLCLRIVKLVKPIPDMMQILGIISQIGRIGLFRLIPASIYRAIFIACKRCGGYLMRRISYIIFEVLCGLGAILDAVTYGYYVEAMASVACTMEPDPTGSVLDTHIHLEEIGFTWYLHQVAVLGLNGSQFPTSRTAASRSSLTNNLRRLERLQGSNGVYPKSVPFVAVDIVAKSMQLVKGFSSGRLCMLTPRETLYIHCSFLHYLFFHGEDSNYFTQKTRELQRHWEEVAVDAIPSKRELNIDEIQRSSSVDRSKTTSSSTWSWSGLFSSKSHQGITSSVEDDFKTMYISEIPSISQINNDENTQKPKRDLIELQTFISNSFENLNQIRNAVTCISSQTPCTQCGLSLLDEEIMACWSYNFKNLKSGRDFQSIDDYYSAHMITCPSCESMYSPTLTIKICSKDDSTNIVNHILSTISSTTSSRSVSSTSSSRNSFDRNNSDRSFSSRTNSFSDIILQNYKVKTIWSSTVHYLSSFSLRTLFDQLIFYEGDKANDKAWLCKNRPELYWNVMWQCTRMGLPNGFIGEYSSEDNFTKNQFDPKTGYSFLDGPIFISWRPCISERMALKSLWSWDVKELELSDFFLDNKKCEEFSSVTGDILQHLNGTIGGMHALILRIYPLFECNKLICSNPHDSKSRLTYSTILLMYYLYGGELSKGYPIDLPVDSDKQIYEEISNKDLNFENLYLQGVDVLTSEELDLLQATKAELARCICTREVQKFRHNLGFLF